MFREIGSNFDRQTTKNLKASWAPLSCISCVHDFDRM